MSASLHVPALHVVILAAGEGKRMKSSLPKVLQKIAGRPMLAHAIDAARALQPEGIHIVHGHGGEQVLAAFADQPDLQWAEQAQQLGTGHAVQQAIDNVPDGAQVLVLVRRRAIDPSRNLATPARRARPAGGAGRRTGRPHRLWPHRPRRRRPRRRDRRTEGRRRRAAPHPHHQYRRARRRGDRVEALAGATCPPTTRRASTT